MNGDKQGSGSRNRNRSRMNGELMMNGMLMNGGGMRRGSYAVREQERERLWEHCGAVANAEPEAAR